MCGATDNKVIAGKGRAAVVVKVDTDVNVFTTLGGMDKGPLIRFVSLINGAKNTSLNKGEVVLVANLILTRVLSNFK
jgi:hypothetical protein